jgi:predicted DNA-binding protein (MmcQ/YjbR family)
MNIELLRDYCLNKAGVQEDQPFGEDNLCFRVGSKIFAITDIATNPASVNLKNTPEKNIQLREEFSCVKPGYHMNKKHWNTITLDGSVKDSLVKEWIDDSYEIVKSSLSKKQKELL